MNNLDKVKLQSKSDKQSKISVEEANIVNYWHVKFKEAMVHKAKETKEWHDYWEAYNGDYFNNTSKPEYKSDHVSNFIFSTIETIRPVMVDNNPRFIAMARSEEGADKKDKVQMALDYEFDRENMDEKIPRQILTTLVLGTSVFFLPWDGNAKSSYGGEVRAIEVNPFNLYPDPLATCVEDAEYLMYATYKHVNILKRLFPKKSNLLEGGNIKYSELVANRGTDISNTDNQVLVLEIWCRDYTTIEYEETDKDGKEYKVTKRKYPRGRVLTIAPELNLLLDDKENPYQDGKFPFVLIKDYDIPFKFWGEGEPKQLLSPQKYLNDLSNQIIDNARLTANMPWVIDKNAGIGYGKLTNRPGLVIRKNPGSEIRREAPPQMPQYVSDKIEELKRDMEIISGVHDVTQGRRPVGIQAGNAIMALQEAGQARIRIKVKLMEQGLSKLATMWYNRMQQYWKLDRWVRVSDDRGNYDFQQITEDDLQYDFDIKITAGSTMPTNKSAMLDLMIRLGQTTAEDGLPMVDRESVLEFVDISDKERVLKRFEEIAEKNNINEEMMQENQMVQQQLAQQIEMVNQNVEQQVNDIATVIGDLTTVVEKMQKDVKKLFSYHEKNEELNKKEEMKIQAIEEAKQEILSAIMGEQNPDETGQSVPIDEGMSLDEEVPLDESEGAIDETEGAIDEALPVDLELPTELIQMIDELSDEELMQLLELKPELKEIIANNLK